VEQGAGGQVGDPGRRRGERDFRVPGYRLAGRLQVRGLHLQPQQRGRLYAEERLAGVNVEVQQAQFLKLRHPAAHGGLVPVSGGGERRVGGTPVTGQLSQEDLVIGAERYLLARRPISRAGCFAEGSVCQGSVCQGGVCQGSVCQGGASEGSDLRG
jgi:hypothetical protein